MEQLYEVKGLRTYDGPEAMREACNLIMKYGLWHLSPDKVAERWEKYSEQISAGWLDDDKTQVEKVFHVKLEEI